MTTNQIHYQELQVKKRELTELGRHNQAVELETQRSNMVRETETQRHNEAQESIAYGSLMETARHNLVTEGETQRHNERTEAQTDTQLGLRAQELDLQRQSLAETHRHNVRSETISIANLGESRRHNEATEDISRGSLGETVRHNLAVEGLNLASLSETSTHNRQTESATFANIAENQRHNIANEQLTSEMNASQISLNAAREGQVEQETAYTQTKTDAQASENYVLYGMGLSAEQKKAYIASLGVNAQANMMNAETNASRAQYQNNLDYWHSQLYQGQSVTEVGTGVPKIVNAWKDMFMGTGTNFGSGVMQFLLE